jgi:hypothetical protein
MRHRGFYTGSLRLEQPWYRRGMKHAGLPEKGPGEYCYDYQGFYFLQENTHRGLVIPMKSIIEVKIAFRHGATFSRRKILSIVWKKGGERISSGFIVEGPEQIKQALTTMGWA